MDFLTKLNLDRFYAHKKPWHPSPAFLNLERVTQINALIQDINTRLTLAPSVAHQSLYSRFSNDYFWQSVLSHPEYESAHNIWQNSQRLIYANDCTLVWLMDYAFPLLEEYMVCGLQECQLLTKKTNTYPWLAYLPGLNDYLENVHQLENFLNQLAKNIDTFKQEWHHTIKFKIEQQTDLLKLIAQKLDAPCDFVSEDTLHTQALALFKQHYHAEKKLKLPHRVFDTTPPVASPTDAHSAWSQLTKRLRSLKENHRFTIQQVNIATSSWFDYFSQNNWPTLHQAKIYLLKKGVQYSAPPILVGLLFTGWLSLTTFGLGISAWFIYPHLHTVFSFLATQWQKWDLILESSSDAVLRDFLVEHTEYIETIERSALWRKNTLAPGCSHLHSFDPSLIHATYESFLHIIEQQIRGLTRAHPYFWQFWRHETATLINSLITELNQERDRLQEDIKNYAHDIAKRLNQPFFSPEPHFLDKILAFIHRFTPEKLNPLYKENLAIRHFLACICQHVQAPVLFNRELIHRSLFATHCIDVVAINTLLNQIQPHIKQPYIWQAISAIAALLKQEKLMSTEQLDNFLAELATQEFSSDLIKQNIQHHLFITFNGEQPAIKKFFTAEQHKNLIFWLQSNQTTLEEAQRYFQTFLDLPMNQDWGKLPEHFLVISPEMLKQRLSLLKLGENHSLLSQIKDKIISLAPYYSGAPSGVNQWLNVLWQEKCPIELEEMIIENRFAWILDNASDKETMQQFIQEMSAVFPKADQNHRLARSLVCQPHFYLPWQAHTQKTLDELEENGLLLPHAKIGYSQKALRAWLQTK